MDLALEENLNIVRQSLLALVAMVVVARISFSASLLLWRRLSICADAAAIVGQSASAVVSHKQQSADSGKGSLSCITGGGVTSMLWKCRVSVLCRDLYHVSLFGVTNMTTQAMSHFVIWRRVLICK